MSEIGTIRKAGPSYELHYPEHGLIVRGQYVEWVLEAAAEIIAQTEKLRKEGDLDELKTLAEFGEADPVEVEVAEFDHTARFEIVPQCLISMGSMDYRWVAPAGRGEPPKPNQPIQRVHDMSLTRSDSFLKNVDGVDTAENP